MASDSHALRVRINRSVQNFRTIFFRFLVRRVTYIFNPRKTKSKLSKQTPFPRTVLEELESLKMDGLERHNKERNFTIHN